MTGSRYGTGQVLSKYFKGGRKWFDKATEVHVAYDASKIGKVEMGYTVLLAENAGVNRAMIGPPQVVESATAHSDPQQRERDRLWD